MSGYEDRRSARRFDGAVALFREKLRLALLETARDQRHQCAEALTTLTAKPDISYIDWQEAHQAVMNAGLNDRWKMEFETISAEQVAVLDSHFKAASPSGEKR